LRNQYYADSRDVSKWSVIKELAQQYQIQTVLQIAMLRPDEANNHGAKTHKPKKCDDGINQFFEEERKEFQEHPERRKIERIEGLQKSAGLNFQVEVITDLFVSTGFGPFRARYFSAACNKLSRLERPSIAFLDPDIGLEGTEVTGLHVTLREMVKVFSVLREGDIQVLYQHRYHDLLWLEKKVDAIRKEEIFRNKRIEHPSDGDVAFITIFK